MLLFQPARPSQSSNNTWLHLLSGPTLYNQTSAQGTSYAIATFALSNAGPRQLMFKLQEFRWASENSRGSATALSVAGHLASGQTTNITLPTTAALPFGSAYLVFWELPWWEQPTGFRRFQDQLRSHLPLTLWRTPPLLTGRLQPPRPKRDEVAYFRLEYGIDQRASGSNAEPGGTANQSQPIRSETNRTSSAAGSRR